MLLAATEVAAHGGRSGGRPGPLFAILLIVLVGFFLVRAKRHRHGGGGGHYGASSMNHLQQRFAAGEINQAEFEHRRAVLRGDKTIPAAPADMAPPPQATQEPLSEEPLSEQAPSDDLDD